MTLRLVPDPPPAERLAYLRVIRGRLAILFGSDCDSVNEIDHMIRETEHRLTSLAKSQCGDGSAVHHAASVTPA